MKEEDIKGMTARHLLNLFRALPHFKGKLRLGKWLFRSLIQSRQVISFTAHHNIHYCLPNTLENLGVELFINGIYENNIVRFLQQKVTDKATFFDVGANIGSIGLPIVKANKNIHYFGFEASPTVFEYLQINFKKNAFFNCELYNLMLHKYDNQSISFYQSELYGKSSLAPTYSTQSILLESISLDTFCRGKNIDQIDWMKVDVQGFELFVFEGMRDLLSKKKVKNILFEFEEWAEEAAGLKVGSAKEYLQSMGYQMFSLRGKPWQQNSGCNDTMIWAKPGF